jgi:glycerophosphoryl diester phosphodiesterase
MPTIIPCTLLVALAAWAGPMPALGSPDMHKPERPPLLVIGHRGAPLRYPEHTLESYTAAAGQGADVLECDVAFTRDHELVCRHSQCDLHSSTNILQSPLAGRCSEPFRPAQFDAQGNLLRPASARCCTSDITLAEFKTLRGRPDAFNPAALSVDEYLDATPDIAREPLRREGTLLSHRDSIELFKQLGVMMIPELKQPEVAMPHKGYSQRDYALQLVDEYRQAGVAPERLWLQSFHWEDVQLWLRERPAYGARAVLLDGRYALPGFNHRDIAALTPGMPELAAAGLRFIGPPTWMLVEDAGGTIVPSAYARAAATAGLGIFTWTLDRSGPLAAGGGWYYQTLNGLNPGPQATPGGIISNDSDQLRLLEALYREVGVLGVFSDWPETVRQWQQGRAAAAPGARPGPP